LKILSQDLFRKTVSAESKAVHKQASGDSVPVAKKLPSPQLAASEDPLVDYYASSNLHERVKQYATEGGIPLEFVERYYDQIKQQKDDNATENT
jgi:hypothetical protein